MASVVLQFSMFVLSWNKPLEFEDELIDVCSVVINGFSGILLDIFVTHPRPGLAEFLESLLTEARECIDNRLKPSLLNRVSYYYSLVGSESASS